MVAGSGLAGQTTMGCTELRKAVEAILLGWPRLMAGSAFGSPGYYVKGHSFAFWESGGLVLRLKGEAQARALATPAARRYTVPRGASHDWVLLPCGELLTAMDAIAWLGEAYQFAGGEPAPGFGMLP